MKKISKWFAGTTAFATLAGSAVATVAPLTASAATKIKNPFPVTYKSSKKAIKGGTVKVAEVSDTPFVGQWVQALSQEATDADVEAPALESLFWTDSQFKFKKGGPANITFNNSNKTATITLRKNLRWSDGSQVTAKDVEYEYELIANPAYGSSRWTDSLADIVGLADYHAGKAKTISGITYPDGENGKVLRIQFKTMRPGFTQSGNGFFLESAEPYQYLKSVDPKKLVSDAKTTTRPLTTGPFRVKKIVPGESIAYERNPYYWGAKPKLNGVNVTIISTAQAVASMRSHQYDIYQGLGNDQYKQARRIKGYTITGNQALYFSALYFNLGHYDAKTSMNVTDRKTPLQKTDLRKAIGYARNTAQVLQKYNNGLSVPANTTVPPIFGKFWDSSVPGYAAAQNLKRANSLLTKAGFKWNSKKTFRIDPSTGKRLTLTYLARSGAANSEIIAQNYIQQWKKVGITVKLYKGKLTDFNTWVSMMTDPTADQSWDFTDGAWSTSSEPSQTDLFSATAPFNFGHFASKRLTSLLNATNNQKSLKASYRVKQFQKYQKYVYDTAFVIPTSYSINWIPNNNRIKTYSSAYGNNPGGTKGNSWATMQVVSKTLAKK
ncbi:MAG: oligopeptide ABC transporter substrate-binding protein [Oenococcus sp.]|uniref:oligopeptide ABC transporter substrate-binding protein n=1 Tax=Oenococcus TaxID=46254 RepID=UPI0021E935AD|nr:oligopeptide ABC transporter substrate-binding protein [Oenococcus kitaharae]MCV3296434.1 oligopeptide ABC transporter substrate-binding protein [Oenococcus kitaharae]